FGTSGEGVLVNQVMPKSPAEAACIKVGDAVLSLNGQPIKDARELQRLIADIEIGKSVELIILREKERRTVTVQIGELPAS
ncbi:MAG TPA: PDZ domain-containing protein, partial [Candidatus Methylomirabilis sp.]